MGGARPRPGRGGPGRDRWIPLALVLPFVGIIGADAVMAWMAARSDPGLVADAPLRIGLANRALPTDRLRLEFGLRPEGGGQAMTLRLRDAEGAPVPIAAAEGRLERATHAGEDRPVPFAPLPGGTAWRAVVAPPDAGAWQVSVTARDAEGGVAMAVVRLGPPPR